MILTAWSQSESRRVETGSNQLIWIFHFIDPAPSTFMFSSNPAQKSINHSKGRRRRRNNEQVSRIQSNLPGAGLVTDACDLSMKGLVGHRILFNTECCVGD